MAVLEVGLGKTYATLAQAVSASAAGDSIHVLAGTYVNDFTTITHALSIVAVGGMANFVATVPPPNGKAIMTVGADLTVDGLSFSGAAVADQNGAGIRYEAGNLVISNCWFHDNQNGLLSAPNPTGTITIDHSEFNDNGAGDGRSHNLYVGDIARLTITNSYFHDARVGHEIKSRAETTILTNNVIADGPNSTASYSIDLPDGGQALISGNVIEKGPNAQNTTFISVGEEGPVHAGTSVEITGNLFISDLPAWRTTYALRNVAADVATLTLNTLYGLSSTTFQIGATTVTGNSFPATPAPAIDTSHPFVAAGPTLAIACLNPSQAEGQSGATPFVFTVTRGGEVSGVSTVRWAAGGLNPNTVAANDFVGGIVPGGTLTFAAGETSKTITVNIQGDQLAEQDEHFHVVLLGPSAGTTITTNEAVATVRNDDTNFAIVSTTGSHVEGNSGATPFLFTVTRSGDLSGSNSVSYIMVGAGPNSVGPNDFVGGVGAEGTLSFAPGEVSQVITINVQGDTQLEPNEYFEVALRQPTGGATVPLNTRTALGLIVDDETSFILAAADAAKAEGNSGSTPFTFTVTRGGNLGGTHLVNWQVSGELPNTVSGADFTGGTGPTGTLTFLPTETSKTITVNVLGDTLVEPDEHFSVLLFGASGGATILNNHATGTILNDDGATPSANGASLTQLAAADFTGDGVTDLLRQSDGSLYLLDGSTAVMSALSIPTTAAQFVAAADFNGDGHADILLQGGAGALYDWTMDGAAVRSVDLVARLTPAQSVAGTADYTGDGRADILLHDSSAGAADPWTLLQPGIATATPTAYATWPSPV